MVEVPWTTIEPGLIEKVVGVMLCRENPRGQRIRPSQGDGGLDVIVPLDGLGLVDDYQIKSFATNLTDGQKKQIAKSLRGAIKTHRDPTSPYRIREWYLTLPLDGTREQHAWLADLASELEAPFRCEWRGLTYVNGLATTYPEVIDYHIGNGRDRVEQLVANLRALVQMPESHSGLPIEPGDVQPALTGLYDALNKYDPHYRYEFHVSDEPPPEVITPGLVASATIGEEGGPFVTWHILARYDTAHEDRPVPISVTIDPAKLDDGTRDALNRAYLYGTAVDVPGAAVVDVVADLPGGLGMPAGGQVEALRLGAATSAEFPPVGRARWAILSDVGASPIADLVITSTEITAGLGGGLRAVGRDTTGIVWTEMLARQDGDDGPEFTLKFGLAPPHELAGRPVHQVLSPLRFAAAWHAPHVLVFGPEHGPLNQDALPIAGPPQLGPLILPYVEALVAISDHLHRLITLPALPVADRSHADDAIVAARVLAGDEVAVDIAHARLMVSPDAARALLEPTLVERRIPYPLTVTIDGEPVPITTAELRLPATTLFTTTDAEPDEDGLVTIEVHDVSAVIAPSGQ